MFFIDHLPVNHFKELSPAVIPFQVTAKEKDKIVNTELSIVDISVHFGSLMQRNRGFDAQSPASIIPNTRGGL